MEKDKNKQSLSPEKSSELSAYLDGELSVRKSAELRNCLEGGNQTLLAEQLRAERESFVQVGDAVRLWMGHSLEREFGSRQTGIVWQQIAGEVRELAELSKSAGSQWWKRIPSGVFPRRVFAPFAGALAAAGVASFILSSQSTITKPGTLVDAPVVNILESEQVAVISNRIKPSDPGLTQVGLVNPLNVPERTRAVYRDRIASKEAAMRRQILEQLARNRSPGDQRFARSSERDLLQYLRIPITEMIDQNFVSGGIRAGAADIDWIRSAHNVKIVPAGSRNTPPVIWVSNRR